MRAKLVTAMKSYDRAEFAADVGAGVIVGIVALSLAIAFAIGSGVTPGRGFYTAVIAGFLLSAFGGSRAPNVARAHLGLAPRPRPTFAVPAGARADRRRPPRPPA